MVEELDCKNEYPCPECTPARSCDEIEEAAIA